MSFGPNIRTNLLVWAGLVLLVAAFGVYRKWPVYSLFKHAAIAQGRVSRELPKRFEVVYSVNHNNYATLAFYPYEPKVGDVMTVHYDQEHPEHGTVFEPEFDLTIAMLGIAAQCLLFPLLAMMFLHHYKALPAWPWFNRTFRVW